MSKLSLNWMLRTTFKRYGKNFGQLTGLSATFCTMFVIVLILIGTTVGVGLGFFTGNFSDATLTNTSVWAKMFGVLGALYVIMGIIGVWMAAAMYWLLDKGQGIGNALRESFRRSGRMILTSFLTGVLTSAPSMIISIAAFVLYPDDPSLVNHPTLFIGQLLGYAWAALVGPYLIMSLPIAAVEDVSAFQAMKLSWHRAQKSWLRIFSFDLIWGLMLALPVVILAFLIVIGWAALALFVMPLTMVWTYQMYRHFANKGE